jgi:hypothetical protein
MCSGLVTYIKATGPTQLRMIGRYLRTRCSNTLLCSVKTSTKCWILYKLLFS